MKRVFPLLCLLLGTPIFPDDKPHCLIGGHACLIEGEWQVISDIKISGLSIRQVRRVDAPCQAEWQVLDHIEMHGPINPDTPFVIEKLLKQIWNDPNRCTAKSLRKYTVSVYMESGGGYMKDGYRLGEILRAYNAQTMIAYGGKCYSSCATAYLGGAVRRMGENATVMFHAPYQMVGSYGSPGRDISCSSNDARLKDYFIKMLNPVDGNFLYERAMSYCSTSTGWSLNRDAAKLFNIVNAENS